MDYEKAYKAVLQTATQWIKDGCTDKEKICLECVFPELRESEDKRIIQFFAELATDACGGPGQEYYEELGLNYDKVMAWLEKQKEPKPVEWSEDDVWDYVRRHNLPVNPEYKNAHRVGCLICPKANFTSNYRSLLRYPKLIDCVIKTREKREDIDWYITSDGCDYADNKAYYVCRWLNHSFRPFSKKQEELFEKVISNYNNSKK